MKPKMIPELFVLRAVACLSITLLHALNRIYPEPDAALDFVKLLLTFGTPAFVFISEMILSYSYPGDTPKTFWQKRFRYIFAPYLFFGAFYACLKAGEDWLAAGTVSMDVLWGYLWKHILLGDYHGYFILIVFQFYALHTLFNRFVRRVPAGWAIGGSLAVHLAYLAAFNFTKPPAFAGADYIWEKLYWLPFAGWLFYFALAYYCGRHYERFRQWVSRYGGWSIAAAVVAGIVVYAMQSSGILTKISSKRVDMVFLTVSLVFLICFVVSKLRRLPPVFVWISQYSFGIYLLHPLWMALLFVPLQMFPEAGDGWTGLVILFAGSMLLSVWSAYILNKFRWGPYFVGKINTELRQKADLSSASTQSKETGAATRA